MTTWQDLSGWARAVIDAVEHEEEEHVFLPEGHAEAYKDTELADALGTAEAQSVVERYRIRDTAAIAAQDRFKAWAQGANWSLFLATVATSSIMVFGILLEEPSLYTRAAAIMGFVMSASAGVCLTLVRGGGLLEKWMRYRSQAEMLRTRYFKLVTNAANEPDAGIELGLLLLEYFRRYQVSTQVAYYDTRGQKHASAARRTLVLAAVAMGGVSLANASAGTLVSSNSQWSALAALALVAQALATSGSNAESLNQDARNAERYERIHDNLSELSGRLDEVREAIVAGDRAVLAGFVDAFQEGLSAENRQWTEDLGDVGSAVDKLGEQLERFRAGENAETAAALNATREA